MYMRKEKLRTAFTLVELMVAGALLLIVMAAIAPQFRAIRNSWATTQESSGIIQNAIVLDEHINRNLAMATQITSVSAHDITNGFIIFKDNLGVTQKYMVSSSYVVFGAPGSEAQLSGPVSKFQVSCYSLDDLETPTTDANNIRLVEIETDLTNEVGSGKTKSFTSSIFLQANISQSCGMAGYWKFDETSGTIAIDSSGSGNNATLVNGASWTTGQIGGAVNLDGWNDYVNCGNAQSLDITGDISIAFWLRADNFSNEPDLITKGGYTQAYSVWAISDGHIRFAINNDRLTSNTALSTSQWYHIAATRSGNSRKIYINGQLNASDTYAPAIGTTASNLIISSTSYPFNGRIDDVRIYDHALSAAEVAQLANTLKYEGFNENKTSSDSATLAVGIPAGTSQGDLLIAAVAADGDVSSSIAAPMGHGWTLIDRSANGNAVTLGAWWKIAGSSEPANHTFTWTGNRQAYGWMMRFTGQDPSNPINVFAASGQSSSSPTSPAVTTTAGDCIILRLGAFDDGDITIDDPGLSSHTAITMDKAESILFEDGFESNFNKWNDNGVTDWDRTTGQKYSGSYSATADRYANNLTSDNINTSAYSSFTIEFRFRDRNIDNDDDVYLQLYDGSHYDNYFELGNSAEDTWNFYTATISDGQYRKSNFRIRFDAEGMNNSSEDLWIDDVKVLIGGVSGGAGYVKQSAAGSSGTSAFSLDSSNEARMLTIAIAPVNIEDCDGEISP